MSRKITTRLFAPTHIVAPRPARIWKRLCIYVRGGAEMDGESYLLTFLSDRR